MMKLVKLIFGISFIILSCFFSKVTSLEEATRQRMEESITIKTLNQFESKKEYWEIFIFLFDRSSLLTNRKSNKSKEMIKEKEMMEDDYDLIIHWLNERLGNGDAPYFYLISVYKGVKAKSKHEFNNALKYYAAGHIISRIDATRCEQPESLKLIAVVENDFLWPYKDALSMRKKNGKFFLDWALKKEEELKERPVSKWVCYMPKKFKGRQLSSEPTRILSDESWYKKRLELRQKYIEQLEKY